MVWNISLGLVYCLCVFLLYKNQWSLFHTVLSTAHWSWPNLLLCAPFLGRFLLQLVGILLEDIVTKQLKVDMSEQQHTFYCQELGTLLMCLIHIFKSGKWIRLDFIILCVPCLQQCPLLIETVLHVPCAMWENVDSRSESDTMWSSNYIDRQIPDRMRSRVLGR
jgi:hypothetical protein